jgi:DNA-binding CsgD family transcriptional regulator
VQQQRRKEKNMTTVPNGLYKVLTANGKSKAGEDMEDRGENGSDEIASNIMRAWEFVPITLPKWSHDLNTNARPADGKEFFLRVTNSELGQRFDLFRKDGDVEKVLDEGKVLEASMPEHPQITYSFETRGRELKMSLKCLLIEEKKGTVSGDRNVNDFGKTVAVRHPTRPPPKPKPPPPPKPEDDKDKPPQPPKPKRERKPRMPRPPKSNRLADLREKMDKEAATDAEIAAVIEEEMNKDGPKGEHTARIAKALGYGDTWVEGYYRLRNLTKRLKPLIDEMGMQVAKAIAVAPESIQWNIWQSVQREEKPSKRAKLAAQLARKCKASTPEKKPARTPPRRTRRERREKGQLTSREREILAMRKEGKEGKEIAAELGISVQTARKHFQNINAKLGESPRAHKGKVGTGKPRATTVPQENGTNSGVEAINQLVKTLEVVELEVVDGDVKDDAFRSFASEQTPARMRRILERGEVISNAIERLRAAYKEAALSLLKDK